MKLIKSFFLYDGLTKEQYFSIRADIHEQNRKNLIKYTILMSALMGVLVLSSFFVESIAVNRVPYLAAFVVMVTMTVLLYTVAKENRMVTMIQNYIFCTIVLGFCTYIGTVTAKDQLATSFCVSLAILPFVTYDIALRSLIYRIIMCIVFVIVDGMVKDPTFVSRDVVNLVCYCLLGTFASALFQKTQAEAFYLRRNMNQAIKEQTVRIENLSLQSITAMAAAIDAKDKYTNGHSLRVAKYSRMLAEAIGKPKEELERIYSVALLHDIGKIGIPDSIINKPERLTKEEYEIIKTHTTQGYEILNRISELPDIAIGARYHHEHYDGSGYPCGLSGDEIPEIARIIAVADAYDAMSSSRSYRGAMEQEYVINEIRKGMGTQFDPRIAGYMLDLIMKDKGYKMHG